MRFKYILLFLLFQKSYLFGQINLPIRSTADELSPKEIEKYKASYGNNLKNVITTQPIGSLRTMA